MRRNLVDKRECGISGKPVNVKPWLVGEPNPRKAQ